jgi:hypothetical protein
MENKKISEGKNTGIKITDASFNEILYFWEYLKNIVSQKYVLGYNFEMPKEGKTIKLE